MLYLATTFPTPLATKGSFFISGLFLNVSMISLIRFWVLFCTFPFLKFLNHRYLNHLQTAFSSLSPLSPPSLTEGPGYSKAKLWPHKWQWGAVRLSQRRLALWVWPSRRAHTAQSAIASFGTTTHLGLGTLLLT